MVRIKGRAEQCKANTQRQQTQGLRCCSRSAHQTGKKEGSAFPELDCGRGALGMRSFDALSQHTLTIPRNKDLHAWHAC